MNFKAFIAPILLPIAGDWLNTTLGASIPGFKEFPYSESLSRAVTGAAINAFTGQDPLRGALAGGLTPVFRNIFDSDTLSAPFQNALTGALSGAIMSDDMVSGALGGAAGGLIQGGLFEDIPGAEETSTEGSLGSQSTLGASNTSPGANLIAQNEVTPDPAADVGQSLKKPDATGGGGGADKSKDSGLFGLGSDKTALLGYGALMGAGNYLTAKEQHKNNLKQIEAQAEENKEIRTHQYELDQEKVRGFGNMPDIRRTA